MTAKQISQATAATDLRIVSIGSLSFDFPSRMLAASTRYCLLFRNKLEEIKQARLWPFGLRLR
jgi:hypothetical protein